MDTLSLAELSEQAEVPPRTIRYYIAQGLLPRPLRSGREATYGNDHLRLLKRIRELQGKGMTLAEVAVGISRDPSHRQLAEPVAWLEYELADDVLVRVRSGIAPWRHRAIRSVLAEAAAKLENERKERTKE